jgi:transposase
LDFITKKIVNISNDTNITATAVCELLTKISIEYFGKLVYLILDNTTYQKCKLVQDYADKLNIKLVYIPIYSPNLNLIDRYWKYVKGLLRINTFNDFIRLCNV